MILVLDSIFQSVGCILIELFTQEFNRSFVLNTSSLLFNIITLTLIRVLKRNYKNQIRNTVNLLSKKLYILILSALIIVGELCGNMAVESNELYFDNRINIFLTSLTIVAFLIIIISLIFSSISTRYYENISRMLCYFQQAFSFQVFIEYCNNCIYLFRICSYLAVLHEVSERDCSVLWHNLASFQTTRIAHFLLKSYYQ